jgi:PHP family Zn ribbon phosphoesterase
MRSERHQELNDLLRIMPELTAYNISLKPKTANYRYCRECRVFFNSSTDLRRCPICGGKLRSGPRVKRGLVYVDPMERLNKSRRQTTLGDFLPNLPRQTILDELWG